MDNKFTYKTYLEQPSGWLKARCKANIYLALSGLGQYFICVDFEDGNYTYRFNCSVDSKYYKWYEQIKDVNECKRFSAYEWMIYDMKCELMCYMMKKFFNVVKLYE